MCQKLGHTADVCRSKSHNHFEAKANFASGLQSAQNSWVLDSGATHHVTTDPHNLEEYTGNEGISMGDGNTIPITHSGSTLIETSNSAFKLSNTLCAPSIKKNLISVAKFCQDNLTSVEFFPFTFLVKDLHTRKPLVQGRNKNGLYEWPHLAPKPPSIHLASTKVPFRLWHCRLGHPHSTILNFVLKKFSLPVATKDKFEFCNACCSNKAHRLPFQRLTLSSTTPFQVMFSDLWGPSLVLSLDKKLYYCIFVDQYTKYTWLYTIKNKSEVVSLFQKFRPLVENFFKTKVKSLYTDGGGEYTSLQSYLQQHGIEHLVSPPYTPQRVAIAERRHRHIVETAKTLLHEASLPPELWSFACQHAVYLINRLPTPILNNESPYQKLFGKPPSYANLKIFGCLCYPWLKPYTKNKLDPKSTPCVYLGVSQSHHAHLCFDPVQSKIFISRDVLFFEQTFPFKTMFLDVRKRFSPLIWEEVVSTEKTPKSVTTPSSSPDILPPIPLSLESNLPRTPVNDTRSFNSGQVPEAATTPGNSSLSSPSLQHHTTSNAQPVPLITYQRRKSNTNTLHQTPATPSPVTNSPLTTSSLPVGENVGENPSTPLSINPSPEQPPMPVPAPAPNQIITRSQNNITKPKRQFSFFNSFHSYANNLQTSYHP